MTEYNKCCIITSQKNKSIITQKLKACQFLTPLQIDFIERKVDSGTDNYIYSAKYYRLEPDL